MIQNCLIRREMAKKNAAGFGGSCGTAAVFQFFVWQHLILRIKKKKLDH